MDGVNSAVGMVNTHCAHARLGDTGGSHKMCRGSAEEVGIVLFAYALVLSKDISGTNIVPVYVA